MQSYLHRKESVVLTCIEIIDELGLNELSSREIAKRQGISEGTLFKHFKNKDEIILAVLDYYSKFDSDLVETVKCRNLNFKDAITYLMTSYSEYYENYRAITSVQQNYEILMHDKQLREKVTSIFEKRSNFIKSLIEKAKDNEEIPCSIDSDYLTDIIIGSFRMTIFKWRMNKYNFSLKQRMQAVLDMLMETFIKQY